jgi:tetratricopeptide (TPR) repeat protein
MESHPNKAYNLRVETARHILGKDEEIIVRDEETGEETVKKKKAAGKPITKEEAQALEYRAIVGEGRGLFHAKEYRRAIQAFTEAMEKSKEDPNVLIDRANCYTRVGQPEDALKDIDLVLREHPTHARAILAKAESYFSMGEFEFGLVFFQRGASIRADIVAFRDGITKCKSAILDSINGIEPFQANPNFAVSRPREPLVPVPPEAWEPKPEDAEKKNATAALLPEKVEPLSSTVQVKDFLGELALDYAYLLELRQEVTDPAVEDEYGKKEDAQIAGVVNDALAYLEQRGAFWSQQGGGETEGESPKKSEVGSSTRASADRTTRSKTAHYEMSKIQQYEAKYGQVDQKPRTGKDSRTGGESTE